MALTPETSTSWHERFHRDGFAIIDGVLPPDQVAKMIEVTRSTTA